MKAYQAPLRDLSFVIEDVLQAPAAWARLPALRDLDGATAGAVLEAAGRFAENALAPINTAGDREGCLRDRDGNVRAPEAYRHAYEEFVTAGWPALCAPIAIGGQGLSHVLDIAVQEMLVAANHGWAMYCGLLHGAVETLDAHGSAELKARYLGPLVSGETLAAMALSEAQAGSDLGLVP